MKIVITLSISIVHDSNPHKSVLRALEMLNSAVATATPEKPALGGALYAPRTSQHVGSYLVEFK